MDVEIRLQMEPKIQESKNPSFQIESLDSGQKDGFLDFLGFSLDFFGFLERVFGFLVSQVTECSSQFSFQETTGIFPLFCFLP